MGRAEGQRSLCLVEEGEVAVPVPEYAGALTALVGTCPLTATAHPPMLTNTSLPANRHRPLLGHMLNGVGPMGSQARLQGILSPYRWREKDGNQCPQLFVTPLRPQQ